jgi:hypothetical protein
MNAAISRAGSSRLDTIIGVVIQRVQSILFIQ